MNSNEQPSLPPYVVVVAIVVVAALVAVGVAQTVRLGEARTTSLATMENLGSVLDDLEALDQHAQALQTELEQAQERIASLDALLRQRDEEIRSLRATLPPAALDATENRPPFPDGVSPNDPPPN